MEKVMQLDQIIRFAQEQLGLKIDGIIGRRTAPAIERVTHNIPAIGKNWKIQRKLVGFVQVQALLKGISPGKIDGYNGPDTWHAFELLRVLVAEGNLPEPWRDETVKPSKPNGSNRDANPHHWPTYSNIRSVFGQPGSHLVTVRLPYVMQLAWNPKSKVSRLTCHRKVSGSITGILETLRDHHGVSGLQDLGLDQYGGMYNYRTMRGGDKLSTHAWAVAIDLDPNRNQLNWNHTKAQMAKPDYQFTRDAFAKEGWVSLGEARDFDWMHFQAVRL